MNQNNINEWSYKRYAKFYDRVELFDEKFQEKINKIYDLIMIDKATDLELIARESGCSLEECVMKIRYLKNKREIGDLYIDVVNKEIKHCSEEDQVLLDKYTRYIYNDHLSIKDMALKNKTATFATLPFIEDQIYKELKYLDSKCLLNGISLNDVDKEIVYYSVEKHKKEKDFITMSCPNCGAINDINRGSKIRCEYCNTIIEAPMEYGNNTI